MRSLVNSAALLREIFLIGFFRAPSLPVSRANLGHFALVFSLLAAALVSLDWLSVGHGPRLISTVSVKNILLGSLPLVLIAWIASRTAANSQQSNENNPDLFGQIFIRLILIFLLFLAVGRAIELLDISQPTSRRLKTILFVWFVLCSAKATDFWSTSSPEGLRKKYKYGLVLLWSLLLMSAVLVTSHSKIWTHRPSDFYEPTLASDVALNNQALLLQEQLALIKPHRPGVADFYFIGFAPDASEDVFKRELETIHPLMDQRFDTAGRSLRLLNHRSSLSTYPVATVSNLRSVLRAFAQKMDVQEDVLVLYLTAHGSKEHNLVARFFPMQLEELNPARLKNLLDGAGIRNRVLIVSACYSGGFIEPLADPLSLIMTASSKEKTSFGCGTDSDFTFFGKALFDEQLRLSYSFEQAFRDALPTIEKRERAIGVVPSDPQIALGGELISKLNQIALRLQARTSR